jgi:hypothetical protein
MISVEGLSFAAIDVTSSSYIFLQDENLQIIAMCLGLKVVLLLFGLLIFVFTSSAILVLGL